MPAPRNDSQIRCAASTARHQRPLTYSWEDRLIRFAHVQNNTFSANQRVQLAHIEIGLSIVLPAQLKEGESILVGAKATVDRLG